MRVGENERKKAVKEKELQNRVREMIITYVGLGNWELKQMNVV